MSKKQNKRYFSEISNDYTVGKLSPKLRKALNLENDMLPFWIYKMRILGYPPAWMQAAESTILDGFNTSSNDEKIQSGTNLEDGEIYLKYNKDSLIEFPGFNAPVPENVKDDWLILGVPPYQQTQQLSVATKSMKFIEPIPYKRPRFDSNSISNSSSDNEDNSIIQSPQEKIIEKDDSEISEELAKNDNNEKEEKIITISENKDLDSSSNDQDNTSNDKITKVISYGIPVPKSRPSLPPLHKWSIGIGELLHFENLPNSTGIYKNKIKGLLDKIRNRTLKT